jgi:molybdopterin-guanine dinucleotide biosynthesis protein A
MHEKITGVILAGGMGRRMDGADKGLQDLRGQPLVAWAIDRLEPQVDHLLISANRNLAQYAAFGYPVLPDDIPDFAGPLAGLHAVLGHADTPLVASVPCDTPWLPVDLVARLLAALQENTAELAVARTPQRIQPLCCLMRRTVLPQLTRYLTAGGRKVMDWQASVNTVSVLFDGDADAFSNINTTEELARQGYC